MKGSRWLEILFEIERLLHELYKEFIGKFPNEKIDTPTKRAYALALWGLANNIINKLKSISYGGKDNLNNPDNWFRLVREEKKEKK